MESMNSLDRLLKLCNTVVGVDISNRPRQRETYVYGRAVFYTVAKELHPLTTLHTLGSYTKRDHASVLFALRNAKDTYCHDPAYLNIYNRVRERISQDPSQYDLRHEKAVSQMNVSAAKYVTELQNKLYDAKKEIQELRNLLSNNILWDYVNQIPNEHVNDFIQNRVIPYINMRLQTKHE
jgi:hypothetical protein